MWAEVRDPRNCELPGRDALLLRDRENRVDTLEVVIEVLLAHRSVRSSEGTWEVCVHHRILRISGGCRSL